MFGDLLPTPATTREERLASEATISVPVGVVKGRGGGVMQGPGHSMTAKPEMTAEQMRIGPGGVIFINAKGVKLR
jgi:hypothetical protein